MDTPQLKRGFLGYRTKSVRALLEERDHSIVQSTQRAATAEREARTAFEAAAALRSDLQARRNELQEHGERLEEAQTEIARLRAVEERSARVQDELDDLRKELFSARQALVAEGDRARRAEERIAELEAAPERSESSPGTPWTTDELTSVLHAAEDAMARLVEGASREAQVKLAEMERAHQRIGEEVDRLSRWRDRVAPFIESARVTIEQTRLSAARIGERIQEAVDPMNQAIGELDRQLAAIVDIGAPGAEPAVIELHDAEGEREPSPTHDPSPGYRPLQR